MPPRASPEGDSHTTTGELTGIFSDQSGVICNHLTNTGAVIRGSDTRGVLIELMVVVAVGNQKILQRVVGRKKIQ